MRSLAVIFGTCFLSCFVMFCLVFPVSGIIAPDFGTAPQQATGTLHVDGSPVGMEITLDGRVAGQVPDSGVLVIDNVPTGQHDVLASFTGYKSQEMVVNVPDSLPAEIRIDLTRQAAGLLDISSSPTNVQIYVNDQYKGITPAVIEVPAGDYLVLMRLAGYQDWSAQVDVTGGETTALSGTLIPVSGAPVSTPSGGPSLIVTVLLVVAGCMIAYNQRAGR